MKTLLQFILQYADFLYLNPEYRITNSRTRGLAAIDAWVSFTGPQLRCDVVNDRGQIYLTAASLLPAGDNEAFSVSLIRQYLEGGDDTGVAYPVEQALWLAANMMRVEKLFTDEPTSVGNCDRLVALRRSNSSRKQGCPEPDQI